MNVKFYGGYPFFHRMGQESSFRGATDRSIRRRWCLESVRGYRRYLAGTWEGKISKFNIRDIVSRGIKILCSLPPIPRRYREGGSRAEIPKCVFLFWKKITRGIYKLWGSKFRGNKKIIQETSRNYFSRFFENSKNFHSHSRCTINKFYSTPLEISLGQIFFHARVNISPDIFTAMADFYV